jgi:hypothetical protein
MSKKYFSVSQYKAFLDCPARAMAEIRGEYKQPMTTALLVGSYVDAFFEGTLEKFIAEHPEIIKKDGTLKADYVQAEAIIKRIEADELFMEYMSGKKQVIKTATLFGASWKIKIDAYHSDKIVDLKIMRSLERIMGKSFVEHWMYDLQMAIYSEVEYKANRKKKKERLPTYLAVATKEDVTNLEIIHIPHWRHQECLAEVEKNMPRFIAYKSGKVEAPGCGVCDYCKSIKKLEAPIDFEMVGLSNKDIALMEGRIF